jgi:hypothetical protein
VDERPGGVDRGLPVLPRSAHEQGRLKAGCVQRGPVPHHLEGPSRRHLVLPLRCDVATGQRLDVAICLSGRGHRQLPGLTDHRDVEGLEVEPSLDDVPDDGPKEAERGTGGATLDASGEAVEWDLGDHGNDPGVVGRDRDDVRTAEGVAP